jgi:hypothetical protein
MIHLSTWFMKYIRENKKKLRDNLYFKKNISYSRFFNLKFYFYINNNNKM